MGGPWSSPQGVCILAGEIAMDSGTFRPKSLLHPSLLRSDASLYCDDVDIRFSKTMNSCKVLQIRYASVERLLERLTDLRFLSIDFLTNAFSHLISKAVHHTCWLEAQLARDLNLITGQTCPSGFAKNDISNGKEKKSYCMGYWILYLCVRTNSSTLFVSSTYSIRNKTKITKN